MSILSSLEPNLLWNNFEKLNAVPRASKKEERVINFVKKFGEELGLSTIVDECGNVIIKKPATKGREKSPTLVIQSHIDMVHQKNADTTFDFETQGINMFIEDDWVKAKGTTLGADNGIGVASIMALLESTNITHPAIEALFTIDEETGMTGALGLKGGLLNGKILLNLDTEDDDELTIGCAGGIDITATGSYSFEAVPSTSQMYKITVSGITGGHSGMDIYKGRANSNKVMNRVLYGACDKFGCQVGSIDGGTLRNAIPRESIAFIAVPNNKCADFEAFLPIITAEIQAENKTTDPNLDIQFQKSEEVMNVLQKGFQFKLLQAIYSCPNGIYRMSPEVEHLVQTSNNLARVFVKNGEYSIQCLTRSSVDSEKMDLAAAIKSTFQLITAKVSFDGSYPGWSPNPNATIVELMRKIYVQRFSAQPKVNACHAGLECGILGANYPGMEMISFGPNIRGAHSPDEKVQISSVQKFWGYLLEVLEKV